MSLAELKQFSLWIAAMSVFVWLSDPRAHVQLTGAALSWFESRQLHPAPLLSLSHDAEYAVAFVCVQHVAR